MREQYNIKCNRCNEIIKEVALEYEAKIEEGYEYDEDLKKIVLTSHELIDDSNNIFSCANCGATLDKKIVDQLPFE